MDSCSLCLLISFLLFLPCLLVAQTTNNGITVGQSLTAGENSTPWLSPSGDFAFGFRKIDGKDLYVLAIWYYKIPDKTIVWYANGDNPHVPPKSRLQLTAENGLVLNDPQGKENWKSGISYVGGMAALGFMNDTGNFEVSNRNSSVLWQSFDNPTDTLLPTQIMVKGAELFSRQSNNYFSRGRFQFFLQPDGNAVLNTVNLPTHARNERYFSTDTSDSDTFNAGERIVFNASGYLYVLRANNQRKLLSPSNVVSAGEYYHRATLDFDGVFVLYSHPKNFSHTEKWSIIRTMPDNICTSHVGLKGSGPCGYNSVCSLSSDRRPTCRCPKGFSLLDPNDEHGGCKAEFLTQVCEDNAAENYEFAELKNTDFPTAEYEWYWPIDIEKCRKACLEDCFCNAIVFRDTECWKKKLPLSNGLQDNIFTGSSFIKIRKGNITEREPPPSLPIIKNNRELVILVSVLLGGSVFINLLLAAVLGGFFFFIYNKKHQINPQVERAVENNLRYFRYKELMEATNGFKEELGRGSFGIVYKGLIDSGSGIPIAVKRLDRVVSDSEKEFRTEVDVIGKTHHKNLVRLLGFCDEGQERLLAYEFLSNGNLANFLFGEVQLSWNQRTHIAVGVAKGLLYLHEECSTQIIHCDIKPHNILLDDYCDAKIADFGLAKLLLLNQSHTYTAIRGTKGYVAPEWFRNLPITVKADVYSFGVLLLEIICCRKSVDQELDTERSILTDWAYDCYREGTIYAMIENEVDALIDVKKVERFVMIAIWCIQEDPSLRPNMKKVVLMLEGIIQVPAPPCPSPFVMIS